MPVSNYGSDPRITKPSVRDIAPSGVSRDSITNMAEEEAVKGVSERVGQVREKAGDLLRGIRRVSAEMYIPVDPLSPEVRSAVLALDPQSEGTSISYPLYISLLEEQYDTMRNADLSRLLGALGSSEAGVSRAWQNELHPDSLDDVPTASLMLDLALHLGIILGLNTILGLPDAPDKAASTLSPNPGTVAAQAALAYGSMWAMHNLDDVLLGEGANEELMSRFPSDHRASRVLQNALDSAGVSAAALTTDKVDPPVPRSAQSRLVLEYAHDYLGNTADPGYQAWLFAHRAVEADRNLELFEDTLGGKEANDILDSAVGDFRRRSANTAALATGVAGIPVDVVRMIACETTNAAERLDAMAEVLGSQYTKDIACCLTRFLGRVHQDWRTGLNAAYQVLTISRNLMRMDISAGLGSVMDSVNSYFENRIRLLIVQLASRFMERTCDPLADFIVGLEEDTEILLKCIGILDLLEHLQDGIERMVELAVQLTDEVYSHLQLRRKDFESFVGEQAPRRELDVLIRLVRAILEAIEAGDVCARGEQADINVEESMAVIDRLPSVASDLGLPTGDNPFRHYFPAEVRSRVTGRVLPNPNRGDTITGEETESAQAGCLKLLTDADLLKLRSTSTEPDEELEDVKSTLQRTLVDSG